MTPDMDEKTLGRVYAIREHATTHAQMKKARRLNGIGGMRARRVIMKRHAAAVKCMKVVGFKKDKSPIGWLDVLGVR